MGAKTNAQLALRAFVSWAASAALDNADLVVVLAHQTYDDDAFGIAYNGGVCTAGGGEGGGGG